MKFILVWYIGKIKIIHNFYKVKRKLKKKENCSHLPDKVWAFCNLWSLILYLIKIQQVEDEQEFPIYLLRQKMSETKEI